MMNLGKSLSLAAAAMLAAHSLDAVGYSSTSRRRGSSGAKPRRLPAEAEAEAEPQDPSYSF